MGSLAEFLTKTNIFHEANKGGNASVAISPFEQLVQFDDDPNSVASGETSILFSGPPVYGKPADKFAASLMPVGAVQGYSEQAGQTVRPFPEIGSRLKRAARSSATYQVTLGRVVTWHSNLVHSLYAWVPKVDTAGSSLNLLLAPGEATAPGASHWTSIESDLFAMPFGLLVVTVTAGGLIVSKEYLEKCLVDSLGKTIQAGQPLIQEQVTLFVNRKVPASLAITAPTGTAYALLGGNTAATAAAAK